MNPPTPTSNQSSWESHPELSRLLKPYSTAAVVTNGSRPQPELWDICNGCILWLPPKADLGQIPDPVLSSCGPAFFDHPILVIEIETTGPRDATVRFVKMTSLRNRPLKDMPPSHRYKYLPIHPAEPHPNSGLLLHLENEKHKRGMIDNSYVSVREGVFSLNYRALWCYAAGQKADGYRHRLQRESFERVTRDLGYHSSRAWIETEELWEEFVRKHIPSGAEKVFDLDA